MYLCNFLPLKVSIAVILSVFPMARDTEPSKLSPLRGLVYQCVPEVVSNCLPV